MYFVNLITWPSGVVPDLAFSCMWAGWSASTYAASLCGVYYCTVHCGVNRGMRTIPAATIRYCIVGVCVSY